LITVAALGEPIEETLDRLAEKDTVDRIALLLGESGQSRTNGRINIGGHGIGSP
jgi:hypothetical protein